MLNWRHSRRYNIPVFVDVRVDSAVTALDVLGARDLVALTLAVSNGVGDKVVFAVPVCVAVGLLVVRPVAAGVGVMRLSDEVGEAVSDGVTLLVRVSVREGVDDFVLVSDLVWDVVPVREGEAVLLNVP
jgi:hypothetical protein